MKPMRPAAILALVLVTALALALASPAAAKKAAGPQSSHQPSPEPNAQGLTDFFKNEAVSSPKSLDFRIDGGYADIRTDSPESSGRYFLASQVIVAVATNIYKLDLTFKKKYQRDVIDLTPEYFFTQERSYYFWYDGGDKIVFKIGGGKKEYKILKKELSKIQVKSLETYTVEKTKLGMDLVIPDGGIRIFLQITFI